MEKNVDRAIKASLIPLLAVSSPVVALLWYGLSADATWAVIIGAILAVPLAPFWLLMGLMLIVAVIAHADD